MKKDSPEQIDLAEFQLVRIQVGTIVKALPFPEARKPAYKLWIKFDEGVVKQSSAQITKNYSVDDLNNKQVICVTNLAPRQIGNFMSEVLVTGFEDMNGNIVLATPEQQVPNGKLLH